LPSASPAAWDDAAMAWIQASLDRLAKLGDDAQTWFDLWQQRVPVVAFPISVWLRYREDRGYEYAALLAYYGFFSIFPLLTVAVTVIGFFLADNPTLRDRLLDSIFARFPVVGEALAREVDGLEGSGVVLIVALGFTLWAGIGVVRVAQDAFNTMWSVSIMRWPSFFPKLLRAIGALLVVGTAFVAATVASAFFTFAFDVPGLQRLAGVVASITINVLALWLTLRVLSASHVGWRALLPGAIIGGLGLWLLQLVGGIYVDGVILGASDVYGAFAVAIGLLVWLALLARVILWAAEINVVAEKRLWPRSFNSRNLTDADERSFAEVRVRSIRKAEETAPGQRAARPGAEQAVGEEAGGEQATSDGAVPDET
jgi:YihY family inner membrane protein